MGYRLWVKADALPDKWYCGNKLYGYVEDDELSSLKYLESLGKVSKDERCDCYFFDYDGDPAIVLSADEFRKFAELYDADRLNAALFTSVRTLYEQENWAELVALPGNKTLHWN